MQRCFILLLFVALSMSRLAPSRAADPASPAAGGLKLSHCLITAVDDVQIPALREGMIKSLEVREGHRVAKGSLAAQIDDAEALLQVDASRADYEADKARGESDLEIKYARATHEVAVAEHASSLDANAKVGNSISETEVRRLLLAADQAAIKIDVSRFEQGVRTVEARAAEARMKISETDVRQRAVRAPLEGEVAEVFVQVGEWVQAGAMILRVIRLDVLRVEGFVKVKDYLPADILNRPVDVEVELAQGKKHVFTGKITFVSPVVQPGGDYRVWAEVENRKDRDQWLLRPGLEAEMTIDVPR